MRWTPTPLFCGAAPNVDCPEGVRLTTEAERGRFLAALQRLEVIAPPVFPMGTSTYRGVPFTQFSYIVT